MMATTPPLKVASVTQPPTPLHGSRYDNFRHQSRKSTRNPVPRARRETGTPPPNLVHQKKAIITRPTNTLSPPPSTQSSPHKTATMGKMSTRSSPVGAPDPFSQNRDNNLNAPDLHSATIDSRTLSMLPTPAKTPAKKPVPTAAMNGAARVLFPVRPDTVEEAMPKLRKDRSNRRHVGFSLYSSMEDESVGTESNIQIFTDSKDKIPELDQTDDNPFLDRPHQAQVLPEPRKGRSGRKRKASQAIEGNPEIKEAFERQDGMVYVFRGKKMFRKFPHDESDQDDDTTVDLPVPGSSNPRALHRSSIKPRLLFPTSQQRTQRLASAAEDEEAATDIEGPNPPWLEKEETVTPVKANFSPATPPTTGHATRSTTKKARFASSSPIDSLEADVSPARQSTSAGHRGKKISPFDAWTRIKAGGHGGKPRKREAEACEGQDDNDGRKKSRRESLA